MNASKVPHTSRIASKEAKKYTPTVHVSISPGCSHNEVEYTMVDNLFRYRQVHLKQAQ